MKNLKKVGAVALAAVMAVTFAPVASLNAFAADVTGANAWDSAAGKVPTATDELTGGYWTLGEANFKVKSGENYVNMDDGKTGATITVEGGTLHLNDLGFEKAEYTKADGSKEYAETVGTEASSATIVINGGAVVLESNLGQYGSIKKGDPATSLIDAVLVSFGAKGGSLTVNGGQLTVTGSTSTNGGVVAIHGGVVKELTGVTGGKGTAKTVTSMDGGVYSPTAGEPTAATGLGSLKDMNDTVICGSAPVALINDATTDYEAVGNELITKLGNISTNTSPQITATNGAVVVSGLRAGFVAQTSKSEPSGKASLDCTPATDHSLAKVVTTFNYNYTNDASPAKTGTATYTAYQFISGTGKADNIVTAINGLTAATTSFLNTNAVKNTVGGTITPSNEKYDRAITLTRAKDWTTGVTGTAKFTKLTTNDAAGGITYFVEDPTELMNPANSLVVIDGSKYVIGESAADTAYTAANEIPVVAKKASKSIEFKTVPGYNTIDKNSKAASIFQISKASVKVTGPEDVTIFAESEKDIVNGAPSTTLTYNVYGAAATEPSNRTLAGLNGGAYAGWNLFQNDDTITKNGTGNSERTLYVSQVAKNSIATLSNEYYTIKADAAEGIDYFSATSGNTALNYTFGATEAAKTALSRGLSGYTENGISHDATMTGAGNIFVSKGITGTFEGVDPQLKIEGELSQSYTKAADGTYTWYINTDSVNAPQNVARFVNLKSGEHLYTINADEIRALKADTANWKLERADAFQVLPWNTTVEGAVKVRRFMNLKTGEFLYSTDAKESADLEKDPNWNGGGVAFCGVSKDKGYVITRVRNVVNNAHVYCTSKAGEVGPLVATGIYEVEGWPFYAVDTPEKEK